MGAVNEGLLSEDDVAAADSFDTTRKSGWIAESLVSDPIPGVEILAPRPLKLDEIAAVHEPAYVTAVQTGEPGALAESQNFKWDPGMWKWVVTSTGGVVAAAIDAMATGVSGSLSGGLHHARQDRGSGFCTFSGLVIAAKAALANGAQSVVILDVDAHCGGGTHSLIKDEARIRHIDVSVGPFDRYEPSDSNTLDLVQTADKYLKRIEKRLSALDRDGRSPLCLYNSGMDPDGRCVIGGMPGIDTTIPREREAIVFDWFARKEIPIAFVIAGGYSGPSLVQKDLVNLHRMTIAAAAQRKAEKRST